MSDNTRPRQPGPTDGKGHEAKTTADPQPAGGPSKTSASDELKAEAEQDTETDAGVADIGADPSAVLAAEVETLHAQISDLTDRLLRAHADIENLRKRAEREKQETARYAITNFAKDTVGLVDNFERAMQAVEADAVEKDPHLKALLEGVAMTEREFLNVLERHGVRRNTPTGQPFDPRLHQAVMERQDPGVANGTVVEVFQSGYTIEERCLRPAIVVVARGGGKAQPASAGNADDTVKNEAASETPPADSTTADDTTAAAQEPSKQSEKPSSDNDNASA